MRVSRAATLVVFVATVLVLPPNDARAGAPLKGVDVKLGRNPGGLAAARTTDGAGNFDFGVVAKGSYFLSITPRRAQTARTSNDGDAVDVVITGAQEGTIKARWDGRQFHTESATSRTSPSGDRILLTSDGSHAIGGTVTR